MILTLKDYMWAIESHLPSALISPEAFSHIQSIARKLPLIPTIGFETRLGEKTPTVDFAACVTVSSVGHAVLAGRGPIDLPPELLATPIWQRIRAFCAYWADRTMPLNKHVGAIWLEFDTGGQAADIPNVLFCIAETDQRQLIAETGLQLLLGRSLSLEAERNLAACFNALPSAAHIFQVGVMLSRRLDGTRICVGGMCMEQVPGYLAAIGWPSSTEELEGILFMLSRFVDSVYLDVDVGSVVSPKIGIECYIDHSRQPKIHPRWHTFLDYLVEHGMCTQDKRDALLVWPGYTYQQLIWHSVLMRGLNHIKIVFQPGGQFEAKAYFGFICASEDNILTARSKSATDPSGWP